MEIHDIVEGKSENREIYDRIKSKGVVPDFDRERYTDMSDQGLEGPFRMKNGQVLYYDPKEGKYYNRDTDMYVDYDDYRKMDESYAAASKKAEAGRQRAIKRAAAAYKRHGDMDRAISDNDLFARDAAKIKSLAGDKVEEQQLAEISKDTMKSYLRTTSRTAKSPADSEKRKRGAAMAVRRLEKEEADRTLKKEEQIEEKFVVVDGDKKILHVHGTLGAANKRAQSKGLDPEDHVMSHSYWQDMHGPRSKRNKEVKEGDKRPGYVVSTKDKPKKVKPSKGGESPHPYQGKLVGEAEVSNTDYEFTHGRKPSGKGSWFFVAHKGGIDFRKDVEGEDYIQLNQMSYSDAKKAAVKWAKSKGHPSLFVAT